MSDVFLSYKHEDAPRAARLVRALEQAGFSVWWDRGLPGGEAWRANIEAALDAAKVVIVCWTRASVGPDGGFVRDEAARAGTRLLPALLERGVRPPLGFGEVQAVDLSHWTGAARDPFLADLVAFVRARLDGRPAPKSRGPAARALQRFVFSGGLTAAVLAVAAFAWTTPMVRETGCGLPVPGLARACCLAGMTEKVEMREEAWTPTESLVPQMYLQAAPELFGDESSAREDAQIRLAADARAACTPPDPAFQRLTDAEVQNPRFLCRQFAQGWSCAVDYAATCVVEERRRVAGCPG